MLQWHHIYRGTSQAGELLAAVEMIQVIPITVLCQMSVCVYCTSALHLFFVIVVSYVYYLCQLNCTFQFCCILYGNCNVHYNSDVLPVICSSCISALHCSSVTLYGSSSIVHVSYILHCSSVAVFVISGYSIVALALCSIMLYCVICGCYILQWIFNNFSFTFKTIASCFNFQLNGGTLPGDVMAIDIPQPDPTSKKKKDLLPPPVPIPDIIKPKMCKYRIEVN